MTRSTSAALLAVALTACPRDCGSQPSGSGAASSAAPGSAPTGGRIGKLGPLQIQIPTGFVVLNAAPAGLDLRHTDGLSATLSAVTRTSVAQDEQLILSFLAEAELDLKKIPSTVVTRVVRTLPGTRLPLRGLAAFTGAPDAPLAPREKRAFWVLTGASIIVTASFIHPEDSKADEALVEQVLTELRDGLAAAEAKR